MPRGFLVKRTKPIVDHLDSNGGATVAHHSSWRQLPNRHNSTEDDGCRSDSSAGSSCGNSAEAEVEAEDIACCEPMSALQMPPLIYVHQDGPSTGSPDSGYAQSPIHPPLPIALPHHPVSQHMIKGPLAGAINGEVAGASATYKRLLELHMKGMEERSNTLWNIKKETAEGCLSAGVNDGDHWGFTAPAKGHRDNFSSSQNKKRKLQKMGRDEGEEEMGRASEEDDKYHKLKLSNSELESRRQHFNAQPLRPDTSLFSSEVNAALYKYGLLPLPPASASTDSALYSPLVGRLASALLASSNQNRLLQPTPLQQYQQRSSGGNSSPSLQMFHHQTSMLESRLATLLQFQQQRAAVVVAANNGTQGYRVFCPSPALPMMVSPSNDCGSNCESVDSSPRLITPGSMPLHYQNSFNNNYSPFSLTSPKQQKQGGSMDERSLSSLQFSPKKKKVPTATLR